MKNKILLGGVAIFGAIVLSGCDGSSGTPQGTAPEKVNQSADQSATTQDAPKQQIFKIGDAIKLGDYVVTVTQITDPYKAKNPYLQPDKDKRLVAVEVLYENGTKDKSLDYNPLDWKMFDSQGYNYDSGFTESKDPQLNSGALNPGGKVRGWITYEVSTDAKDFKMQFTPNFLSNDNVEVQLY